MYNRIVRWLIVLILLTFGMKGFMPSLNPTVSFAMAATVTFVVFMFYEKNE